MEFDQFEKLSDDSFDDSIDLRDIIEKYIIHWKWFIFSVLLFGSLTYFNLKKEIPKYQISGTVLIKEQERGSSIDDFSTFEDLGLSGSNSNSLENEIHVLTSRRLMKEVVKELKLDKQFFIENEPYDLEQYPNFPLIINIIDNVNKSNNKNYHLRALFSITVLSNEKFEFFNEEGESIGIKKFEQIFNTDFSTISISLNKTYTKKLKGKTINVIIRPLEQVVDIYRNKMIIEPLDDRSRVLNLSIRESIRGKGVAIINNLIEQYNLDAVKDKNQIFLKTTEFLNDRLILLRAELVAIETTAEQFMRKNKMVDRGAGEIFLQSSSANESELISTNVQLKLINYMLDELIKNNNTELLPTNIGLSDISIINLTQGYNELILRRNRILKSSRELNPIIIDIDSQLKTLKNNLKISLINLKSSIKIQFDEISSQTIKINSRIASVPKNEREFKDIVRQQETKDVLYLFLLQKREESILSKSVNINKAKIIDRAYSSGGPVSPKKKVTYLASILFGLLIPFGVIYIKDFLDTKVHDEKDLQKLRIPIIGDVPEKKSKIISLFKEKNNSITAEAFRYIRTNLEFMLDSREGGKIIFVTSTIKSEGKTFTAINLASSIATSGKRTLLIGMDLRSPKFQKYLKYEKELGVTNYIKDYTLTVDDITDKHTRLSNLDIINSGDIPPNPVELLMSKRVKEIFDYAKERYKYIIVDTSPVGMVTDTIQISKYADLTIYVIKANFLDKRKLHIPNKLHKENKLPNMAILINGTDHSKGAYGYGYGYGYGNNDKKPWYKKVFVF